MDDDELSEKRLCIECINEPVLADLVAREGALGVCSYCGRTETGETVDQLADRFEALFEAHFERASGPETPWDQERGDSVAFLIEDIGRLPEQAASDIQEVMAERHEDWDAIQVGETTAYDAELTYVESGVDDRALQADWAALETELRIRHRFFSEEAGKTFAHLFGDVHALVTRDGRPVVRTIGPGTDVEALYRARAFQSDARFDEAMVDPEQFVGTPAPQFATAGRMNPKGVPFFYGATGEVLALNEVRPPVGSKVIVGRFALQRQLQILDVDALETVLERGSLFDSDFAARLERAKFLGRLARRIRMPVLPDDESTDYLITQVMADFLAVRITPALHGVAYGSAQGVKGAINIALFNASARVRAAEVVPGAEHSVHAGTDGDGEIDGFFVSTTITPPDPPKAPPRRPPDPTPHEPRPETLVLERDSLRVHIVKGIAVDTDDFPIYRFSHTVGDPEPF